MLPVGSSLPSAWRRLPHAFPGLGFADPRTSCGETLEHGARLVGDDADRPQVILVEVARQTPVRIPVNFFYRFLGARPIVFVNSKFEVRLRLSGFKGLMPSIGYTLPFSI